MYFETMTTFLYWAVECESFGTLRFALHGGNCNNTVVNVGAFYVNLNNTPSNANWNIGAAPSYP